MTGFQVGTDALKRFSLWCGKRPRQHQRQIKSDFPGWAIALGTLPYRYRLSRTAPSPALDCHAPRQSG
jgi:hypothetical protein